MARKKKTEELTKKDKVIVYCRPDEDQDAASAKVLLRPETQAAVTIQQWQGDIIDVNAIADELKQQTAKLNLGNMERSETMLMAQAHTLDELFNHLARKACQQQYLSQYEIFLKLALKAQTQCRATLETLSTIRNPPTIYAKQANISNGPQQVNNGVPAQAPHAEEIKNQPNELLERQHGDTTLDTGTTIAAIGKDKAMAALE